MHRSSTPKRTGIYRVNGDIANFQLEFNLRRIGEWLLVPKFEYAGAKMGYVDHYPNSPRNHLWSDCFIYVPHEDYTCNNGWNYLNYCNPSSGYPGSEYSGSSKFTGYKSNACCSSSGATMLSDNSIQDQSLLMAQSQDLNAYLELDTGDTFVTQNKELCNGAMTTICIGWQQKHFSLSELQHYEDVNKRITPLHRCYHRWALDIIELQKRYQKKMNQEHRLRHGGLQEKQHGRSCKTGRNAPSTATPMSSLGLSDCSLFSSSMLEDSNFAVRTCLIHTIIDADIMELQEYNLPPDALELHAQGYQLMYVYAQLPRDTLLLSLRYAPAQRLLYVYPDFTYCAKAMDYIIEIDNDCRQLYAYGFQSVSSLTMLQKQQLQNLDQPEEKQELKGEKQRQHEPPSEDTQSLPASDASAQQLLDYYQRQRAKVLELRRLTQFTPPPKRMRRVTLLLELREAQNFESPNIHVRYYINTPRYTLLEPANPYDLFPLRGATATCLSAGDVRVARFSHCWQITLLCEESHKPTELLHIYFEVISIDSWLRERCEGYAHFSCSLLSSLPVSAATGIRLQCIRPQGNWLDALNRYFIGGRSLFDFVGYFRSREDTMSNRLELQEACVMRSTGRLLFSIQKLQQCQQLRKVEPKLDDSGEDEDDSSEHGLRDIISTTLDEILTAYVEASERIESLLSRGEFL